MATREYKKNDLTVVWDADKCIHSRICFTGLKSVFNPNNRPWVNIDGATESEIRNQIDKCPSGALSYITDMPQKSGTTIKVEPLENGPLMVYGEVIMKTSNGEELLQKKATAFCRCGHSENKPYCDGAHRKSGFVSKI